MDMKKLFALVLPLVFSTTLLASDWYIAEPDSNLSIIDKGVITVKLADGKHKMYEYDYRGALLIFREILVDAEDHPMAHFRIAQCQYELKDYELARKYGERALELDPAVDEELHYVLAQTYHRLGELDLAIENFNTFKQKIDEKRWEEYEIDFEIAQCEFAKEALANPAAVTIESAPGELNSRFDDKAPMFYGTNGDTLFFTSRRSDAGGARDEGSDFGYYENIYMSIWNAELNGWSEGELVEGKLNTDGHTASNCMDPTGEYMYITVNIEQATGSSDIWYSKISSSGKWGNPKPVSDKFSVKRVNSTYYESSACLSPDGQTMYFISERPDGSGQGDIYRVDREGKRDWGEPVNLGDTVNSFGDENTVWLSPDGNYLFFCSNGHPGMGGYDIFRCEMGANGIWSAPVNLGAPINSVNDEAYFMMGPDGYGYICAMREGGEGERDILRIDLSEYDVFETLGK